MPQRLDLLRFHFGEAASISPTQAGAIVYRRGEKYFELGEPIREIPRASLAFDHTEEPPTPFVRGDFGDRDRLTWPGAGCTIPQDARIGQWAGRFAVWQDDAELVFADATRAEVVRIALPFALAPSTREVARGDGLWLESPSTVTRWSVSQLLGLFEHPGPITLSVREHYPNARPTAQVRLFVKAVIGDRAWLEGPDSSWSWVTLPLLPGIERGTPVTLYDQVMTHVFREYALANGLRLPIHDEPFPASREVATEVRVERAVDPAGQLVRASGSARGEDLARVFGLLADDPDDQANQLVVVDLLEDAGEPYAGAFAALLAGDESARDAALGPLDKFFVDIDWRGILPREAELAGNAPLDDDLVDLVVADHRLGFLTSLRLGGGNFRLYSKIVASPRAVGLRHADGSRAQILTALIAAKRTNLTRLSHVKFATREVIDALADPTFDRVARLETVTRAELAGKLFDFVIRDERGFFARGPRHLVVDPQFSHESEGLVAPALAAWPKLPVAKLTIAGVTIMRDGTAFVAPEDEEDVAQEVRDLIAAQFRFA